MILRRSLVCKNHNSISFNYRVTAFLAPLNTECSVSYCDHSPSVVVRPSVRYPSIHNFLVNTLASTNIDQSAPNLVKMYMTLRSRMRSILELIGPDLSELSALELENLPYLSLFALYHLQILTNQHQTVKMYMTLRSGMSSVMELIGPELSELSALELENLPYLSLFALYHLQILTNQYQTWPQYIWL